jgi:SAM-dependent methyltransferase
MSEWDRYIEVEPTGTRELSRRSPLAPATVETVNSGLWATARYARSRARARLRPAEAGLLERYGSALAGDVLELASAGGRLTHVLSHGARTFCGVALGRAALGRCEPRAPLSWIDCRDLRDLDRFGEGQFTAVVIGGAAIDLFGDAERHRLLDQLGRVLSPDGLLLFSSHNLGSESLVREPARAFGVHPLRAAARLARLPRALRNRTALAGLQERERGWGILNDGELDYGLLHYYVSRDHQEQQLADHAFLMLECLTPDDELVDPGAFAYGHRELYYVAVPAL